jgi:hypothetical protein
MIPDPRLVAAQAWKKSLESLRANLLPGLILQAAMAAMTVAYFLHPGCHGFLEHLSEVKGRWGLLFSFLGTSLSSALLPELLRPLLRMGKSGGTRALLDRLLFALPFWGLIGMQVDLFYRLQYLLFGPSSGIGVIATKVLVDAFVYCPLLAVPQAVCAFRWKDHGFTLKGFRGEHPLAFYAVNILPVLIANWIVWIPVVCVIYSLPPALGIPFFIVAQAFWVMVLATLSARSGPSGGKIS